PGYGTTGVNRSVKVEGKNAHTLGMEGALQSLDTKYTPWGTDPCLDINDSNNIYKIEMLLEPVRNAAIVSWQTSSHGESCLKYGESGFTNTINSDSDINIHSVKLIDLLPDIEYKIKIEFSSQRGILDVIGTFIIPPDSDLEFQSELASLINKPIAEDLALEQFDILTSESSFVMPPLPTIVPPVYGRWHYGKYRIKNNKKFLVDASYQKNWVDELNLDPRHRSEAALGTQVVRKNQEDLMASAWDQLGAVESVNDLLRKKQFARESSKNILNRIAKFSAEKFISAAIPFQKKIIVDKNEETITVQNYLDHKTLIPKAVINSAFQTINTKMHKKRALEYTPGRNNILKKFMDGRLAIKKDNVKPSGTMTIDDITNNMLIPPPATTFRSTHIVTAPDVNALISSPFESLINTELISKVFDSNNNPPFPPIEGLSDQTTSTNTIGKTLENWLNFNFSSGEISVVDDPEVELQDLKVQILHSLNPEKSFLLNTKQLLRIDGVLQSQFKEVEGDSLDPLMAAPEFPQPMNESLLELSKNLFLPGIEKIKPNTIGLLETNPRFLEAFMCGLNHELGSELLWRGYPTDQRGSYFRQFWDVSYNMPTPSEKQIMLDKWLEEHGIEFIEELDKEKKEMIIYRHSRLFLRELKKMYGTLITSSRFNGENLSEENKTKILNELGKLIKRFRHNYPDTFKDISNDVFEAFNPFINKMVEKNYIKESRMDIEPIHLWKKRLGKNAGEIEEKLVLTIRGDLLKRYPNAIIYAVDGYRPDMDNPEFVIPALEEKIREYYENLPVDEIPSENLEATIESILDEHPKTYPIFGAQALPDITFLGFPFNEYAAVKTAENPGKYFVIEEHVSEPRYGLDTPPKDGSIPEISSENDFDNISWANFELSDGSYLDTIQDFSNANNFADQEWNNWINASSALKAELTFQKPVRIIIGANGMLP
ncbi:MAG: hypothetical protein KAJ62_08035, partial [Desulfobacteraceae bacterium]|nr:hypothetical protein [Desulfobacteraceae bacterium]